MFCNNRYEYLGQWATDEQQHFQRHYRIENVPVDNQGTQIIYKFDKDSANRSVRITGDFSWLLFMYNIDNDLKTNTNDFDFRQYFNNFPTIELLYRHIMHQINDYFYNNRQPFIPEVNFEYMFIRYMLYQWRTEC